MTQVMKASDARMQWSHVLNTVFRGKTRVVVEKSGIPVAAVISAEDLKRFTQLEIQRDERFKALNAIRDAFQAIPADEIEREITSAIKEVRLGKPAK